MTVYEFAKGLILEAGNNVTKIMQQEIEIETKSNPNDLVTNVDKATEKFLFDNIKKLILIMPLSEKKGMGMIYRKQVVLYGSWIRLMAH